MPGSISNELKIPLNEIMQRVMQSNGAGSALIGFDWATLWDGGTDSDPTFGTVTAASLVLAGTITGATTGAFSGAVTAGTLDIATGKLAVGASGLVTFDGTDASGTPGAAVINKPKGQVAVAIGESSVVVTNSLVTAASHVVCTLQFVDAGFTQILSVVPGTGTFTITGNAIAVAATKIGFTVFN